MFSFGYRTFIEQYNIDTNFLLKGPISDINFIHKINMKWGVVVGHNRTIVRLVR